MKLIVNGKERRLSKVYENTANCFVGVYKGHTIEIARENAYQVYIVVYSDKGYSYDGYWGKDSITPVSMADAIVEAIRGSEL